MKKLVSIVLVLAMALTVLTGCGNSNTSSQPSSPAASDKPKEAKDTIIFTQGADITSLDPHIGKQLRAFTVTSNMFDQLVKFDDNMKVVPSLAESWERISDTAVKFKLREDVKFHNGDPLTSEDVKFSFDRMMASSIVSNNVSFLESVEIVDGYNVILHTKGPYAPLLAALTTPPCAIVPKKVVEADEKGFALNPVGTGPYKFVEWKQGEYCKLEAFDGYYGEKAKTKYVIMKVVPENTQRTIMLETGEADVAYEVLPNDVSKIESNDKLQLLKGVSLKSVDFGFNTKSKGPVGNKLVRQAIECAIDKKGIVEGVLYGIGQPGSLPIAPAAFGYSDKFAADKYDVEKAKALLAEAGYKDGFEIRIWTDTDQAHVEICQVVQNQLAEIGIKANIEVIEYGTLLNKLMDGEDYDMELSFFNNIVGDADYALYSVFHPASKSNHARYDNPEVSDLIIQSRGEVDDAKRTAAYDKIYNILSEDTAQFSIYYEEMCVAINKNVEGFKLSKIGAHKYQDVVVYK
jgi:peptide/nickel transport system substrate-binding protein